MSNEYSVYCRDGTYYIRDLKGNRWTVQARYGTRELSDGSPIDPYEEILLKDDRSIVRVIPKAGGAPTYGRFSNYKNASSGKITKRRIRAVNHGLMNFVLLQGSWAWLVPYEGKKQPQMHDLMHGFVGKRIHTKKMKAATLEEVGEELSATQYARKGGVLTFNKGHSAIRYDWCHLVGHGLLGKDIAGNIVAATTYQNSEQLILESVLHDYRMEKMMLKVEAKLAYGWKHLAESIWFRVMLNGDTIYSRTMDARRATKPDFNEYTEVSTDMRRQLNRGLKKHYSGDDMTMETFEAISNKLGIVDPSSSTGLWKSLMETIRGEDELAADLED
ncbi:MULTISPECIES: hypothetical protein [unclassified Pseudomonas]|uniref:hypothetical protein n=1 Tax=unclassified Pseudomonas TaxID=196821 RepID=UPI0017874548|nr:MULTISPECIES: hypothetical protein [unclassified Pseudomonas]MBD9462668.1 hypothetical protein [Pseudomonas sp. Pdm06]